MLVQQSALNTNHSLVHAQEEKEDSDDWGSSEDNEEDDDDGDSAVRLTGKNFYDKTWDKNVFIDFYDPQ